MTSVKLGVHLPVAGRGASQQVIAQVAEEAERIGLDSVWSWERLMRPTVPIALGGRGGPVMDAPEDFGTVYDPVETLSYVAARTSRITLGTSVLDALFQSPIILARRLATLDRFSEGRLIVGVGQGWMEQEFEAAGVSMKPRDPREYRDLSSGVRRRRRRPRHAAGHASGERQRHRRAAGQARTAGRFG
jgi:alkanesulfonate monooxygenase SsuD/methylene tetrahydromethanopterin reductase-like flavin-dependent oxidoreductase (luciferase family)